MCGVRRVACDVCGDFFMGFEKLNAPWCDVHLQLRSMLPQDLSILSQLGCHLAHCGRGGSRRQRQLDFVRIVSEGEECLHEQLGDLDTRS